MEYLRVVDSVLIVILTVVIALDVLLLSVIEIRKITIRDEYYGYHQQFGVAKLTIIKLLAVLYAYCSLFRYISGGKLPLVITLLYGGFVLRLLIAFIRQHYLPESTIDKTMGAY